jgi:hypothetical protein
MPFVPATTDFTLHEHQHTLNFTPLSESGAPWAVVGVKRGTLTLSKQRWSFGPVSIVPSPTGDMHQSLLKLDVNGLAGSTDSDDQILLAAFNARAQLTIRVGFGSGGTAYAYLNLSP